MELMNGVEDIPLGALDAGMQWSWETFPQFLDSLDKKEMACDVGCLVAHGPVRAYAMGKRVDTSPSLFPSPRLLPEAPSLTHFYICYMCTLPSQANLSDKKNGHALDPVTPADIEAMADIVREVSRTGVGHGSGA